MAEAAAESLLHTIVAAVVVAALLRLWRVEAPSQRLRLLAVALALPVVTPWGFAVLAPARAEAAFADTDALFASARWQDLRPLGVPAGSAVFALTTLLGVVLLLRDLVPFAAGTLRPLRARVSGDTERVAALTHEVAALAPALGIPAPAVSVIEAPAAVVLCTGCGRRGIVVSEGALDVLEPQRLRAALAHELAHVARRDPAASWLLLVGRVLLAFNPVAQLLARRIVEEMERRADDDAVAVTREPHALAGALVRTFRHGAGRVVGWPFAVPWLEAPGRLVAHFRARGIEARCRRLLESRPAAVPQWRLRLALTVLGLVALLYRVV
jgi:Zn-dependent protease with chaperone function